MYKSFIAVLLPSLLLYASIGLGVIPGPIQLAFLADPCGARAAGGGVCNSRCYGRAASASLSNQDVRHVVLAADPHEGRVSLGAGCCHRGSRAVIGAHADGRSASRIEPAYDGTVSAHFIDEESAHPGTCLSAPKICLSKPL